jgi:hypothetical protein
MATISISELPDIPENPLAAPLGTPQALLTYTANAQSAALKATTRCVRLQSSAAFHLAVGTNPVATTAFQRYEANTAHYVPISGHGGDKKLGIYDGTT